MIVSQCIAVLRPRACRTMNLTSISATTTITVLYSGRYDTKSSNDWKVFRVDNVEAIDTSSLSSILNIEVFRFQKGGLSPTCTEHHMDTWRNTYANKMWDPVV